MTRSGDRNTVQLNYRNSYRCDSGEECRRVLSEPVHGIPQGLHGRVSGITGSAGISETAFEIYRAVGLAGSLSSV